MKRLLIIMLTMYCVSLFQYSYAKMEFLTCEEPPTNYTEEDEVIGIIVDIVKEMMKTRGYDPDLIQMLPWARAYAYATTHPDVMIFTAGKNEERIQQGFNFIGPVISRKHGIYKLKSSSVKATSLDEIKTMGIDVGGMRGDWRSLFVENYGIEVDLVATHEMALNKLIRGRNKLWISSDIEMPFLVKKFNLEPSELEFVCFISEAPSYIMISKGTEEKDINAWYEAFDRLVDNGMLERTASKWGNQLKLDLQYTKNKGIHFGKSD